MNKEYSVQQFRHISQIRRNLNKSIREKDVDLFLESLEWIITTYRTCDNIAVRDRCEPMIHKACRTNFVPRSTSPSRSVFGFAMPPTWFEPQEPRST